MKGVDRAEVQTVLRAMPAMSQVGCGGQKPVGFTLTYVISPHSDCALRWVKISAVRQAIHAPEPSVSRVHKVGLIYAFAVDPRKTPGAGYADHPFKRQLARAHRSTAVPPMPHGDDARAGRAVQTGLREAYL